MKNINIPKVRIAVIAHGDYCDGDEVVTYEDFCDKTGKDKLVKFVRTVPMTGGGDYPEAYEYGMCTFSALFYTYISPHKFLTPHHTSQHITDQNTVLHIAQKLKWNKRSAKALVLIGDITMAVGRALVPLNHSAYPALAVCTCSISMVLCKVARYDL